MAGTSPGAGAAGGGASTANWIKSHQIEGDGLIALLYHHLWKKNKNFQSCPLARCPDTVVYEHNFPRGWYAYDAKNREIVKRAGKYLDTVHIYNHFSKSHEGSDIVAQYCHTAEDDASSEILTSVEFFTKEALFHFLNIRKDRPDGILQKFLPPKTKQNHQIQAIWSPRVTLVQRRMNKHALTDRFLPPYERCVTFDGPSHYSEDGHCAHKTKEHIKKICASVVDHFHNTDHKSISRMVLYFKVDKNDNIWLLWGNSLRIGPVKYHPGHHRIPLNLSPLFVTPKGRDGIATAEDDEMRQQLLATDEHQIGLSNDRVFARTVCGDVPSSFPRIGSPSRRSASAVTPARRSPPRAHTAPLPQSPLGPSGILGLLPAVGSVPELTLTQLDDGSDAPDAEDGTDTEGDLPFTPSGLVARVDVAGREQVERLRAAVAAVMDDIVYDLYSHFMRKTSSPYVVAAPAELATWLSAEEVDTLLVSLSLARNADGLYTCRKLLKPIGQLNESLSAALDQLAETRLAEAGSRLLPTSSLAPAVVAPPPITPERGAAVRSSPFGPRFRAPLGEQ